MKKTIYIILSMLAAAFVDIQAKTIHWLTFIDTTDSSVGEVDLNIRRQLYSRCIDIVNASLGEHGYNVDIIDVYGSKTTPENCKDIVNSLQCGSEDIVVFYYVGHGTENTGTSKFPLMLMAQSNANKFVPLSWVHETLKRKGARLTVSVGMCCNARQGVLGKVEPAFGANYGSAYVSQEMSESIKKLFLYYRGDLIATSSSPAESSWACSTNIGPMDFFTFNLIAYFNTVLPDEEKPNWESMLSYIKQEVYEGVKEHAGIQSQFPGTTQTPIWDSNLSLATSTTPVPSTPTTPTIPSGQSDNDTKLRTDLNEALAYISSCRVDEITRMRVAERLKGSFVSSMVVRILSQDGDVVVDKESISDYLGRISTSRLLMNVSVDYVRSTPNGKIDALRVREIYKKKK